MVENNSQQPKRKRGGNVGGQGFKKGQSGNPGGRPTEKIVTPSGEIVNLRELARSYTLEAVTVIANCIRSNDQKVALAASQTMLDRGWGRAAQAITGEDGEGPVQHNLRMVVEFVD